MGIEAIQAAATMELTGIPKEAFTAEGTTSKGTEGISCEAEFCIFLQTQSQNFTDKGCTVYRK
jgi:hypothetical protein